MNKALDPKGLEAALAAAWSKVNPSRRAIHSNAGLVGRMIAAAIEAYLSASTPEDVAGLVERLRTAAELLRATSNITGMESWAPLHDEAATALTSLAGERDRLKESREDAFQNAGRWAAERGEWKTRAEAAESKLSALTAGDLVAVPVIKTRKE